MITNDQMIAQALANMQDLNNQIDKFYIENVI